MKEHKTISVTLTRTEALAIQYALETTARCTGLERLQHLTQANAAITEALCASSAKSESSAQTEPRSQPPWALNIVNHRLLESASQVPFHPTPNQGGKFEPKFAIIHYTAGPSLPGAIRTLTNPRRKASAHLIIDRNGTIVQLVPFDQKAWHAGKSTLYIDSDDTTYHGLNKYSFGIELVNSGKLHGGNTTWYGATIPDSEIREDSEGGRWHSYTPEQIEATENVVELLIEQYKLIGIYGHSDIAPRRKIDPGPAFPMEALRDHLLTGRDDDGGNQSVAGAPRDRL